MLNGSDQRLSRKDLSNIIFFYYLFFYLHTKYYYGCIEMKTINYFNYNGPIAIYHIPSCHIEAAFSLGTQQELIHIEGEGQGLILQYIAVVEEIN